MLKNVKWKFKRLKQKQKKSDLILFEISCICKLNWMQISNWISIHVSGKYCDYKWIEIQAIFSEYVYQFKFFEKIP